LKKTYQANSELTIVIPSTGRSSLISTLNSINHSSMVPGSVIIALPPKVTLKYKELESLKFKLTIINAQKKGQVRQRFEGIKLAKSNYILQIDDDIELKNNCIEKLFKGCIRFPKKVAISPKILERKTSLSFFEYNNLYFNEYNGLCYPNVARKIFNLIIHGKTRFLPGEVTKLGTNIQAYNNSFRYIPVEWLHGMLIQHKDNYLDFEHLHFSGKAFSEDLIFSSYLQSRNIQLFVDNDAIIIANIDDGKPIRSIADIRLFLVEKYCAIRNNAYFCYISNRRYKTFILFSLIKILFFLFTKIISKVFKN